VRQSRTRCIFGGWYGESSHDLEIGVRPGKCRLVDMHILHRDLNSLRITNGETEAIARRVACGEHALAVRIVRPGAGHRVGAKYCSYLRVVW
jgi:hypothetical protein